MIKTAISEIFDKASEILYIVVDLFCGFGGTTMGFEDAKLELAKIAEVYACVNHDPKAIKSHWLNNKRVKHFNEDMRTLDLTELIALTEKYRAMYPSAKLILWASLECTNFSKAKGGMPRDADSRTLADHLPRYVKALNPDYIKIENVVEFMSWGPLIPKVIKDKDGFESCPVKYKKLKGKVIELYPCLIPESKKNGQDFMRWRKSMCALGYRDEWKELNSANFGAYTSRNRLFGVFARPHLPIAWPAYTHAKTPSKMSMYGDMKKWMPVKDVLNFEDEGESIFTRKKPLSDNTLERIYAGLVKYIAKGDTAFISKYFSGQPSSKNIPVDGPAGTIKTRDGQSLVSHALVQGKFLVKYISMGANGRYNPPSIDEPSPVISTQDRLYLAQTEFLQIHNGKSKVRSVEEPCPTIATNDRFGLVQPEHFIEKQYTKSQNQSIDDPAGTIMPTDKHRLVTAEPFIMPTAYQNQPKSVEEPAPTITASRRHHYLINPSWGGNPGSVDEPCCVIVARQDKAPLSFVQVEHGPISIAIYDNDSPVAIRIKQFMAAYGLMDIKMRMLRVPELLKIQGFPEDYKMVGNQSDQKKFIGNSVVPHVVKAWAEAMGRRLLELNQKVA